jgi:hypothetical protein
LHHTNIVPVTSAAGLFGMVCRPADVVYTR